MAITSPNMGLPISTVGVDTGTTWETNLVASQTIIDGHNHTSGSGVQITPAAININSAMTFNNNQAVALQASVYTAQSSLTTLNATYVSGVDLYYNDGNGVAIKLTSGGVVNSTSSGISSGGATASFAAGVLVVDSAALTPANIQCASILMGNNVASSNYLTLGPPVSMPTSYSLVLPSLPASTLLMTLDSSGNMGTVANTTIANTLGSAMTSSGANAIAATMTSTGANAIGSSMTLTGANAIGSVMTSTGANVVANVRTRLSSNPAGKGGIANDITGTYTNSTTTPSTIVSVTLTTSGRPVMIVISPEIGQVAQMTVAGTAGQTLTQTLGATFSITRTGGGGPPSFVYTPVWSITAASGSTQKINSYSIPQQIYLDLLAAGTWTYTLQGAMTFGSAAGTLTVAGHLMVAYEL